MSVSVPRKCWKDIKKIVILKEYIEQTEQKVQQYNQQQGIDDSVPVNGVHQTNLGVFRAYLELYLKNLPVVNSDLTYMVRQLQPTEKGIPLRCISSPERKDWVPYEKIQADVFDHIFAVVPYFGLKSIPKSFFCRYSPGFRKSVIGVLYKKQSVFFISVS